jgi:hypothetical protein
MSENLSAKQAASASPDANARGPLWPRFFGLAILGAILAMVAVAGYSTAYCSSLGGAVFWTVWFVLVLPVMGLIQETGTVLPVLVAYLLFVFFIAGYTRLRPTLLMFTLAVVVTYALSIGC